LSTVLRSLGIDPAPNPLRKAFLAWQCRVRQIAVRENEGRPDAAITPDVTPAGWDAPLGRIITVLCRAPGHSATAELMHMVKKTNDPAQRREQALRFLAASYYQKPEQFSDILTATFPPGSPGAASIRAAEWCTLSFDAFAQRFDLRCRVWKLSRRNPLYQATWWHNQLFNPNLHPESEVLGYEPDWSASTADPMPDRQKQHA
jgi:hypothetical protein